MNMQEGMIDRALYAAGRKLLSQIKDDDERKEMHALCKKYYLSTYLEALSEVEWVSARRRRRLMKVRHLAFDSGYRFAYTLPYDCARPIELAGKADYIIEGKYLCTNQENAELLYVTNGRILPGIKTAKPPKPGMKPDIVLFPGGLDEAHVPIDETFDPGWFDEDPEGYGTENDDFPEYRPLDLEPKFFEFLEKLLAARLALAENPQQNQRLLQEAYFIKQEAVMSTKSQARAKINGGGWWSDRLGFGEVV